MASLAHKRFYKNYDYDLLNLSVDRRGFVVGQSRLGITRLHVDGEIESIKADFVNITCGLSCNVNDGAWLDPEVSSLSLISRNAALFRSLDDAGITLKYDDGLIFEGFITESRLTSEIGEDNTEEFTVTLTARGFEVLKNDLAVIGSSREVWNRTDDGGRVYFAVSEYDEARAKFRVEVVTGREAVAEDDRADVQLQERMGIDSDVSGNQGEKLQELAHRTGLLLDASDGATIRFRSYQQVPRWIMTDEHLVSGYDIAVDREAAAAVIVTRKQDDTFIRAYRAGGSKARAESAISTISSNPWDMESQPAYIGLAGTAPQYLGSCTVPRHDDLPLVHRLPILASFKHGGATYRGAVVQMTHSISTERWTIGLACAAPQLVTRSSDLSPGPPRAVAVELDGTTANLTWAPGKLMVTDDASNGTYFVIDEDDAGYLAVGDELRIRDDMAALAEDAYFTVTAIGTPASGMVNVSISPEAETPILTNWQAEWADSGVAPRSWQVWYQQSPTYFGEENLQIGPTTAPHETDDYSLTLKHVTVYTNSASIPQLANGYDYRFTVYADGQTRSAPSLPVEVSVTDVGLDLDADATTNDDSVTLSWTWGGATLDGFRVGRDGLDTNGAGPWEGTVGPLVDEYVFDDLLAGHVYHVYVAALLGGVELERIQLTATTTGAPADDPDDDPHTPDDGDGGTRRIPLMGKSGLDFNSIVFLPNTTGAGATEFGTLRDRPMDGLLWFTGRQTWTDFRYAGGDHAAYLASGHLVVTSMPHAPESEGDQMNQRGADNAYRDQQRALGAWLAANGLNHRNHAIRVDWECNGNWYHWSANRPGGPAALREAIKNYVINVRAGGATNVKFDLCFNKGPSQTSDFVVFPGAEYIDVIGVDPYDWYTPSTDGTSWTSNINRSPGLQTVRDFAVTNGIQWALDEGGNVHNANGGNDNPYYWQKVWDFTNDSANLPHCAWHNTYDHAGAPDTLHHDFASNPDSWDLYKTLWGGF